MRKRLFAVVLILVSTFVVAAPGDPQAGETKSAACAACHGLDGNSSDPQFPKIAGQHADYVGRHLALFKSGERESAVMQPFASMLSEQDMADLGAYFSSKQVGVGTADEPLVALGAALYRGGSKVQGVPSCMGCHGPTGRGNPASKYPAIGGQHANYSTLQLERFRAGTVYGKDDYPNKTIMSQVAKTLTDADIVALSSYLEGLHAAK